MSELEHRLTAEIASLHRQLAEAEAKVLGQGHIEAQRDQFARELDDARVGHCPTCEAHARGELERDEVDCVWCRIGYLAAQESLLQEWQDRAEKAEAYAAEVLRPLDEQMARLNARVTELNSENARLLRELGRAAERPLNVARPHFTGIDELVAREESTPEGLAGIAQARRELAEKLAAKVGCKVVPLDDAPKMARPRDQAILLKTVEEVLACDDSTSEPDLRHALGRLLIAAEVAKGRYRTIPDTECLDCGNPKTECPDDCPRVRAHGGRRDVPPLACDKCLNGTFRLDAKEGDLCIRYGCSGKLRADDAPRGAPPVRPMSNAQFEALQWISAHAPVSLGTLDRRSVDALERRGYVQTHSCGALAGEMAHHITPEGKAVLADSASNGHQQPNDRS